MENGYYSANGFVINVKNLYEFYDNGNLNPYLDKTVVDKIKFKPPYSFLYNLFESIFVDKINYF